MSDDHRDEIEARDRAYDDQTFVDMEDLKELQERFERLERAVMELAQVVGPSSPVEPCANRPGFIEHLTNRIAPDTMRAPCCWHTHPFLPEIPPVCCWCGQTSFGESPHGPYRPEP